MASLNRYAEVRQHFSEEEMVSLTLAIVVINGWNLVAVGFRSQPGIYQSTKGKAQSEVREYKRHSVSTLTRGHGCEELKGR